MSAFRDMTYGPFMVGAFSHCNNVGKLPKQLPGIPLESKVFLNRYDFMEASVMLKLYIRYLLNSFLMAGELSVVFFNGCD